MNRTRIIAAAVAALTVVGGAVVLAAPNPTPVDFQLDCTLTGRTVECVGELPEATSTVVDTTTTVEESTSSSTTPTTSTTPPSSTSTQPSTSSSSLPPSTVAPPTTEAETTTSTSPSAPSTSQPATSSTSPTTTLPASGFTANFSAQSDVDRFDWQVFHGGVNPFGRNDQLLLWQGDHNMACGAPTTSRDVHMHGETDPGPVADVGELVWWCAPNGPDTGHVMTSMLAVGYAHIDFSPRQAFTDVDRVCWDQNLTRMGGRKWTQVVVVGEDMFQANDGRMEYVMHDLQNDVAVNGIPLSGDTLMFVSLSGSSRLMVGQDEPHTDFLGYTTPDKAQRFRHCLVETATGIAIEFYGRPFQGDACTFGGCDRRFVSGAEFPEGPVRVIFQDVTYDSPKGDGAADNFVTWHWDQVEVA